MPAIAPAGLGPVSTGRDPRTALDTPNRDAERGQCDCSPRGGAGQTPAVPPGLRALAAAREVAAVPSGACTRCAWPSSSSRPGTTSRRTSPGRRALAARGGCRRRPRRAAGVRPVPRLGRWVPRRRLAPPRPDDGPVRGDRARTPAAGSSPASHAEASGRPCPPLQHGGPVRPHGRRSPPRYRKLHLFDVAVEDGPSDLESARVTAGDRAVVVGVDGSGLGLSICYDLRFPELYRALSLAGAEVLAVPAVFTERTGRDHWEVLLRARAIENGAYVIAAAGCGAGGAGAIAAWGHSMVVDPWGRVVVAGRRRTRRSCAPSWTSPSWQRRAARSRCSPTGAPTRCRRSARWRSSDARRPGRARGAHWPAMPSDPLRPGRRRCRHAEPAQSTHS